MPENFMFLRQRADRLLGCKEYHWSAIGAGRMQMPICATAGMMIGACRVRLEDKLYIEGDVLSKSSSEQVRNIRDILKAISLGVASPSEAINTLGLR